MLPRRAGRRHRNYHQTRTHPETPTMLRTDPATSLTRRPLRWLAALATAALLGGCVVAPYPYGEPVAMPSTFDRSWEAALGAASDAGVQVTAADRASGRISGAKAGAAVTIQLQTLADGRVQVAFDAPTSRETHPTLQDRWLSAYNRRMGR
jgi:hypothetical protein